MNNGVYIIKNKVSGKVYVGSAVNIERRWRDHKYLLRKSKHHSPHLQSSWDKHGEENFEFIVIEPVKNSLHLVAVEQTFLDYYKSYDPEKGYNVCRTAGSPMLGKTHSEETKRKMSEAKKQMSPETKRKIGEAQRKNAKGYYYHKARGKYRAAIIINKKSKSLGYYNTPEEARAAYLNALEKVQQKPFEALTEGK